VICCRAPMSFTLPKRQPMRRRRLACSTVFRSPQRRAGPGAGLSAAPPCQRPEGHGAHNERGREPLPFNGHLVLNDAFHPGGGRCDAPAPASGQQIMGVICRGRRGGSGSPRSLAIGVVGCGGLVIWPSCSSVRHPVADGYDLIPM
jgi:hypothetical protein